MTTVGFIGLGRLGTPFVKNLVDAGHEVVVCQRGRSDEAAANGATVVGGPADVAAAADVVMTCMPTAESLAEVCNQLGDVTVIELSTFAIAEKEAQRAKVGDMLDCPVSGTPKSAADKEAVIFASGDKATYDRVAELLGALTPKQLYVGPFGAATNMKFVANFLAFTHVTVAAEAMAFAGAVGLDQGMVAKLISNSVAATSGQFNIRAPLMAEGRFESTLVTVDMMRKDLDLITEHARSVGASARLLEVVKDFYDQMAAAGDGDADPAKLSAVLLEQARGG
jgi:3-hydroxyisobutyrate dehydrogenase-like beta-hydroxyacid dehydrogenase